MAVVLLVTVADLSQTSWHFGTLESSYTYQNAISACFGFICESCLANTVSINCIKTCRRSYFFAKVECRTSHWGKWEQAPIGIKYSTD